MSEGVVPDDEEEYKGVGKHAGLAVADQESNRRSTWLPARVDFIFLKIL